MARYSDLVTAARPDLTGKIDWYTALYMYYAGLTPEKASARTIAAQKEDTK
jgi:hypothetical protein